MYFSWRETCHTQSFFQMQIGECVGVLGANAAGKSTLLAAMAGECELDAGSLLINGHHVQASSLSAQARMRAVLPQQSYLSFNLKVSEVIQMGGYAFPELHPRLIDEWVLESLMDTDLLEVADANYTELSGGQQQRVQFARVLVQTRAIAHTHGHAWIFLDEPTACLDPKHQQLLIHKIHSLTRTMNIGAMVILHDLNLAAYWCDRLMLIKNGAFIANDIATRALTQENLQTCFDVPLHTFPHPMLTDKICIVACQ